MPIKIRVIEPEKIIVENDADEVGLITQEGCLGILPGHVPLAVHLKEGEVTYIINKKMQSVRIKGGFARVLPDSVTVFTY
jgi:F-type H+-transporting ATPase subunit epsilon